MEFEKMGQLIAERRYVLSIGTEQVKEVILRLGTPQRSPDNTSFVCPFEIAGVGNDTIRYVYGEDAFQALILTLKKVGVFLHYLRQSYGSGFYLYEPGDDLGFPEEAWTEGLAHQIVRAFGPLYGLKLRAARLGTSTEFEFDAGGANSIVMENTGQYVLKVECPWRIVLAQCPWRVPETDLMITGYSDWVNPTDQREDFDYEHRNGLAPREKLLEKLFQHYDSESNSYINISNRLIVEQVKSDDYGGLDIHLNGDLRLQVFPTGKAGEHWRLFQPGKNESQFVIRGRA